MGYERDPLSVRFDRQAAATITLVIEQRRKHEANSRLVPYVRVRGPAPIPGNLERDSTKYRLTSTERAFVRALYYDSRIHKAVGRRAPRNGVRGGSISGNWSLKIEWDAVPVLPTSARNVRLTVFPDSTGARYARRQPARERYGSRAGIALRSEASTERQERAS